MFIHYDSSQGAESKSWAEYGKELGIGGIRGPWSRNVGEIHVWGNILTNNRVSAEPDPMLINYEVHDGGMLKWVRLAASEGKPRNYYIQLIAWYNVKSMQS